MGTDLDGPRPSEAGRHRQQEQYADEVEEFGLAALLAPYGQQPDVPRPRHAAPAPDAGEDEGTTPPASPSE